MTLRGPSWCDRALRTFLRDHPDLHIVAVLPLEYALQNEARNVGTQELVVVFTDRGPWPRANTLEVVPVGCSGNPQPGARSCANAIEVSGVRSRTKIWVPLSRMNDEITSGTFEMLALARKETTSPAPAGDQASTP
jgi:hypothetical protein